MYSYMTAKTQKAKGILACKNFNGYIGTNRFLRYPPGPVELVPGTHKVTLPCFARPCPITPRHGFVDSRNAYTIGDVFKIFDETKRADQEGELVCMPRMTGKFSSIATNGSVTLGRGNAAATEGHGTLTIPFPGTSINNWLDPYSGYDNVYREYGVKECVYYEIVEHMGQMCAVQMRDGPPQPSTRDYIPRDMTVSSIVEVDPFIDFLEWEKQIANVAEKVASGDTGIIIWHKDGNLSSHYAVHAIANKIPVYCGSDLYVGKELSCSTTDDGYLNEEALRKLRDYIEYWSATSAGMFRAPGSDSYYKDGGQWYEPYIDTLLTSVGTIHGCGLWGDDDHLLSLRGFAIAMLPRFITTACVAECRHWYGAGPGSERSGEHPTVPWEDILGAPLRDLVDYKTNGEDGDCKIVNRWEVYDPMLCEPERFDYPSLAKKAADDLAKSGWQQDSYGGNTWAEAAKIAHNMYMQTQNFIINPNKYGLQTVITSANSLIATAHNGGKVLDKWVSSWALDVLNRVPNFGLCNIVAAEVAFANPNLGKDN